jgi:hypothetical protein
LQRQSRRAAGRDESKRPAKWRDLPSVQEFAEHISGVVGISDNELFETASGDASIAGTWAHWQIGLACAKSSQTTIYSEK